MRDFWQSMQKIKCAHCGARSPKVKRQDFLKFFQIPLSEKEQKKQSKRNIKVESNLLDEGVSDSENSVEEELDNRKDAKYLHPLEVKAQITQLSTTERQILSAFFCSIDRSREDFFEPFDGSIFFVEVMVVPPNRFRPENRIGGDGSYLHKHSAALTKIMTVSEQIRDLQRQEDFKLNSVIGRWLELQESLNKFYDESKSTKKDAANAGIKQLIEKKEGMFRMKMMGKRVNYAGRSVISPDPMIGSNEVGIPIKIATTLTFAERVSDYNRSFLEKLVINGSQIYPGANFVKINNTTYNLGFIKDINRRKEIAEKLEIGSEVRRHMLSGDFLFVNRQPTLHRSSIMSHKAKVLKGQKTIRLHYANCKTYNADFDGDEMNVHFLQDQISRSEAKTLSNTSNQYIVPTSGEPIRGLIQDSIVSGVYLTLKDTFFRKEEICQLLYLAIDSELNSGAVEKIVIDLPAILKPKPLWTGKQLITALIKSLTSSYSHKGFCMQTKSKISDSIFGNAHKLEGVVVVRDNELLTGVLDKNHLGTSEFGIIHSFYEIYGPEKTDEFISCLGKLLIGYIQFKKGFTCGIDDVQLNKDFNVKRRLDIEEIHQEALGNLSKHFEVNLPVEFELFSNRRMLNKTKEKAPISFGSRENKAIKELIKLQNAPLSEEMFDEESVNKDLYTKLAEKIERTINESSKGEANIQMVVENVTTSKSSSSANEWLKNGLLKSFPSNCFSLMVITGAKGSNVNLSQVVCLLGQQSLEGKRVPKMANGKTLPCFDQFDPNPRADGFITDRFNSGIRPQEFFFHCMAGREGLIDTAVKTSRSGYLQRCLVKHLEQLTLAYDHTVRDYDGNVYQFLYGEDGIDTQKTSFFNNMNFVKNNIDTYLNKYNLDAIINAVDTKAANHYKRENKVIKEDETILSALDPWRYYGSISEKMQQKLTNFCDSDNLNKANRTDMKNAIYLKYLRSLAEPGEGVGVVAAQSIGEPSTQMTLNTFHLAGHGGVNMTLGIPRLKEILMTSEKNIKTPIMILPLIHPNKESAKKVCKLLKNYKLKEIVKETVIKKITEVDRKRMTKMRVYSVKLVLENLTNIQKFFHLDHKALTGILENFAFVLLRRINRKSQRKEEDIMKLKEDRKMKADNESEGTETVNEKTFGSDNEESDDEEKEEAESVSEEESIKENKQTDDESEEEVVASKSTVVGNLMVNVTF